MKKLNLVGSKFGMLHAIERVATQLPNGNRSSSYKCKCDCGNETIVACNNLKSGTTRSCGCLRKLSASKRGRKPTDHVAINQIRSCYYRNAKNRNIDFDLDIESIRDICSKPCYYCGRTGANSTRIRSVIGENERIFKYNGIDRIDNLKPYESGNCVPACKRCNQAKNDMSEIDFLDLVFLIAKNHEQQQR